MSRGGRSYRLQGEWSGAVSGDSDSVTIYVRLVDGADAGHTVQVTLDTHTAQRLRSQIGDYLA